MHEADLEAYLDEALPPAEMARIEQAVREEPALVEQLAAIHARRNAGVHSVGEIWRQHRLSCPTRDELGGYLLDALSEEISRYIAFHIEVAGCRYCLANLADLRLQQAEADPTAQCRRRKFFQSSAGLLKTKERGR